MTKRGSVTGAPGQARPFPLQIAIAGLAATLLLAGCNNYTFLPDGAYRPKHPAYTFATRAGENKPPAFLDTTHLYLSASAVTPLTRKEKKEGALHRKYCGFFGDGRFITGKVPATATAESILHENGIATADLTGYYLVNDHPLRVEFFAHSSDGIGYYYLREGRIEKDTVFIWVGSESGERITDTLLVSPFPLDTGR